MAGWDQRAPRDDRMENVVSVRRVRRPASADHPYRAASSSPDAIELSWRWDTGATTLSALFMSAALIVLVSAVRWTWAEHLWFFFGCSACACAVAVPFWYRSIAWIANGTTVTVADDEISIAHGPVPLRRGVRVPRGEILSVFVAERSDARADVMLARRDAPTVAVVQRMVNAEHAERIARTIEEHLRITDVPVAGEEPKR